VVARSRPWGLLEGVTFTLFRAVCPRGATEIFRGGPSPFFGRSWAEGSPETSRGAELSWHGIFCRGFIIRKGCDRIVELREEGSSSLCFFLAGRERLEGLGADWQHC